MQNPKVYRMEVDAIKQYSSMASILMQSPSDLKAKHKLAHQQQLLPPTESLNTVPQHVLMKTYSQPLAAASREENAADPSLYEHRHASQYIVNPSLNRLQMYSDSEHSSDGRYTTHGLSTDSLVISSLSPASAVAGQAPVATNRQQAWFVCLFSVGRCARTSSL